MNKLKQFLFSPRRASRDISQIIFLTLLLSSFFTLINPSFVDNYNLVSIGQNLAPYALLTIGVMMPIAMAGTDLSIGANCIASAVIAGTLYSVGMPLALTIPVMILCGSLIGLINGIFIAVYDIQPFIVTLSTMMFSRGISAIFAKTPIIYFPSDCWYNYIFSNFHGFPISFVWILIFSGLAYFIFRHTKLGRYMISIGSNERSAFIAGVDVKKYKIIGYTLSGLMAGVAAIFWSSSFITISAATGNGMELDAIAAVYIGGTRASGGFVNVIGGIIGSIMLVVIRSGLNFSLAKLNIQINSTYVTYVLSGIIVIVSVLSEKIKNNSESKKKNNKSQNSNFIITLICFVLSILMIIFLFVSSYKSNHNDSNSFNNKSSISVVMKIEGNDFWDTLSKGAKKAGEDYEYEVLCRGPESEDPSYVPKHLEIANSLISDNTKGIAIAAIGNGYIDYLNTVYKKGIPVVEYDSGLFKEDKETIINSTNNPIFSYIKADNYKNASLAAEKAFAVVKDDIAASEHYNVGVVQHGTDVNAKVRSDGFTDRFMQLVQEDELTKDKCSVYVEVKPSDKDNAYKAALEYLFEKGDLRLVFGTNETTINQFADTVFSLKGKYDEIKFVGYDVGQKAIEWIKSDNKAELIGVIDQNPFMIGYLTAETLIKKDLGEEVESEIVVPGVWYDKNNIDSYEIVDK